MFAGNKLDQSPPTDLNQPWISIIDRTEKVLGEWTHVEICVIQRASGIYVKGGVIQILKKKMETEEHFCL